MISENERKKPGKIEQNKIIPERKKEKEEGKRERKQKA